MVTYPLPVQENCSSILGREDGDLNRTRHPETLASSPQRVLATVLSLLKQGTLRVFKEFRLYVHTKSAEQGTELIQMNTGVLERYRLVVFHNKHGVRQGMEAHACDSSIHEGG